MISADPTVEPPALRHYYVQPDLSRWEEEPVNDRQTRIVFENEAGACTTAYALTRAGAQKALYALNMRPNNQPVDL